MSRPKSLSELGLTPIGGGGNVTVTGLSVDSREVRDGTLFAALPGVRVHGAEFGLYAVRQGAIAVLTDKDGATILKDTCAEAGVSLDAVSLVIAEDPRQALAYAAALFFERQPETIVAVTGTNGKTSVATFVRQIWTVLGESAVNVGTTGIEGAHAAPLIHTTPEPITLHRALARAAEEGVTHAAMEASSHGLSQRRLDGVRIQAAGFTNFSQDHLDYHETLEAYFAAKTELFERLLPDDGTVVANIDDPKGADVMEIAEARGLDRLSVGRHSDATLKISARRFDATGQDVRFQWNGVEHQTRLSLIGGFQAENVLVAAGLCIAAGSDPAQVFEALPELETVRGRMQRVAVRANGAAVYVDYAHTPDALKTALVALRPHVLGRIVCVFGAGGDRDPGKRVLMGRAVAEHADVAILTDDNPRNEDPDVIRAMVREGCPDAVEVPDRAEAILRGVDAIGAGDTLLIAGKGHETGQIVGDDVFPFNDAEQASVAVAALEGGLA